MSEENRRPQWGLADSYILDGETTLFIVAPPAEVLGTRTRLRETMLAWLALLDEINDAGRLPRVLRVDRRTAFASAPIRQYCAEHGVALHVVTGQQLRADVVKSLAEED